MNLKHISDKKCIGFILLGVFLLLVFPFLIRVFSGYPLIYGSEPYHHSRMSTLLLSHEKTDMLVYSNPLVSFEVYHFFLAPFVMILGFTIASLMVPILLGICSVICIWAILKLFHVDKMSRIYFILLFAISPFFLSLYTRSNPSALLTTMILLGVFFFIHPKKQYFYIGSLIFAFTMFFGLHHAIIILLGLYILCIYEKRLKNRYFITLIICIFGIAASFFPLLMKQSLQYNISLQSLLSDFGGSGGLSVFLVLLAGLGIALWKKKREYPYGYLFILALILFSFFFHEMLVYANFALIFLAVQALLYLSKRKWVLPQIKYVSLLLIICGILFSTLSYANQISEALPNQDIIDSLVWLKENTPTDAFILSDSTNGFWIKSIAERKVLLDEHFVPLQGLKDADRLFASNDIRITQDILNIYSINFVFTTENLYSNHILDKEDGLGYLFQNKETFKKSFSNQYSTIWGVLRSTS